jgi:hypothetical protein
MENLDNTKNTPENKTPDLTIADLTNLRAVVDVAVRRGAFSASEISGVGSVYDKLNAFLNALQQPKSEEPNKAPQ